MPRDTFDQQLRALQDAIVEMGAKVDTALDRSIHALVHKDMEEAHQVIADDVITNRAQHDIEERCIVLLATQQPMARDLRIIVAILNIVVELERIGDYAEGIGKIALRLINEPVLKPLIDIPRMAVVARGMVVDSLRAFVERDAALARSVAEGDDDGRLHAGEGRRQDHVRGDGHRAAPVGRVVPVDPEEVARIRRVGIDGGERGPRGRRDGERVDQLGERRQDGPRLPESPHRPLVGRAIHGRGARA